MELLQQHFALTLAAVQGRKPLDPVSVHAIRKELRRARAGLRLVREAVGERAYAEENARLRDAARPLSPARDADVALETVSSLLGRRRMHEHAAALRRLRAQLRTERAQVRGALQGALVMSIGGAINDTARRVANWRLPHDSWPIFAAGVERIYRRGRKSLAAARAQPGERTLHELRKQVKYLGAAMTILGVEEVAERADKVASRLGKDHDLGLLRPYLNGERALAAAIVRRRGKLQRKALKKAQRLYRRKPAKFIARLV